MDFSIACKIYNELKNLSENNEDFKELFDDFSKAAVDYGKMRMDWKFLSLEDKISKDNLRTRLHNGFIICCSIITRYINENGIDDISWWETIKDDRKVVGDFACYICSIIGIESR